MIKQETAKTLAGVVNAIMEGALAFSIEDPAADKRYQRLQMRLKSAPINLFPDAKARDLVFEFLDRCRQVETDHKRAIDGEERIRRRELLALCGRDLIDRLIAAPNA